MENDTVKGFIGTFRKADKSQRKMRFVRMQDMPVERIPPRKRPDGKKRVLKEGTELVWDLDAQGYRTFNWNTVVGDVPTMELTEAELPPVATKQG